MLSRRELLSIAKARISDAKCLMKGSRFDGAVYLCGYAIELGLKARIVKTLRWDGFPSTNTEFKGLGSFRIHDLDILLHLTGWETKIKIDYMLEWSSVASWNPETRYLPIGSASEEKVELMIKSAGILVGIL